MFGVDPGQLAKAKALGQYVTASLEIDKARATISLKLLSTNEQGSSNVSVIIDQLSTALPTLLSTLYGIRGKMTRKD